MGIVLEEAKAPSLVVELALEKKSASTHQRELLVEASVPMWVEAMQEQQFGATVVLWAL